MRRVPPGSLLRDFTSAQDIHDYLHEAAQAPRPETLIARLLDLRYEAALLHSLLTSEHGPQDVLLVVEPLSSLDPISSMRLRYLASLFEQELAFSCQLKELSRKDAFALHLSGPGIWPLVQAEVGVHMFCRRQENLIPVQISALPIAADEPQPLVRLKQRRSEWLAKLKAGQATTADDPFPLGNILRFYDEGGPTIDLRSGLTLPHFPTSKDWKTLLLASLPLPPELLTPTPPAEPRA